MKTFLLLSVLFLSTHSFIGQHTIDLEADLVSVDTHSSLSFYKKVDENTFLKIKVIPEITSTNEFYLTTTEYRINQKLPKKDSTTFAINSLPNTTPAYYLSNYFNKNYSKESNIKSGSSNKYLLEILESAPNGLFTLSSFYKNNKSQDPIWEKKSIRFLNYFFIRINKRKTILVFINNANPSSAEGFFMATTQKPLLFFNEYPTATSTGFKETELLNKEFPDSLLLKKTIEDWAPVNYSTENGEITDLISHKNLLEKEFDTVFHHSNFIVGKKDSATDFYNKKLQNITPKNLRAIYFPKNENQNPFYDGIQVLVGNEVKWLTVSGELKDSILPVYQAICGTGMSSYRAQFKITQDENYFYLNNRPFAKTSTYDDVYLINGTKEYQSNDLSNFENYIKVQKDGKWGIIDFKNNSMESTTPLKTSEILAVDYDKIELVGALIKLKKEGLWGYFQINESPKYNSLEKFNNYFARFTLPNKKRGWLTTDGKEYLDE